MSMAVLRDRAPSLAVAWTTAAGLALVAPLEHAAGIALHLGWWHAWTITGLVEGAAGSAIVSGQCVPAALALTGSSVLLGAMQSAGVLPTDDPLILAVGVTLLAVASLLLVHVVRRGILAARAAAAAVEEERAERERAAATQAAAEERAHRLELQRLLTDRAQQEREGRERSANAEHERAMERERAARFAEEDRDRRAADRVAQERAREEARLESERVAARRAADELERDQIVKDREAAVKRREREEAAREAAERARETAVKESRERLAGATDEAAREWRRLAEVGDAPSAEELAEIRGCSLGRARNLISEWRRPHAVPVQAVE